MEKKQQLTKSLTRFQDQKVGLMLVACFLASMLFLVLSKANDDISLRILTPKSSLVAVSARLKAGDNNMNSNGTIESRNPPPLCDVAQPRSEFCEMDGDIRIHGNSSSVTFVSTSAAERKDESYTIRPYARKGDDIATSFVREVHVESNVADASPPPRRCTVNHTATPAVVFSTSAYAGNIFHDYSDIMIPLFLTSRQYQGEVRFLVADINPWWLNKYKKVVEGLSNYPVIDFDKDTETRCFSHVTVGLKCSKELSIDPSSSPNGYSMPDFTKFLRASYNLSRHAVGPAKTKPRAVIISRSRARAFTNVEEIVRLARETGFEPVVAEAKVGSDVARFAETVNSCDVMVGVHGAGLTNLLYLPANATVVQIVPWGGLGWVARYDYGVPAVDSGLNYLHYEIKEEESSLVDVFPRDHAVFKDPFKYHKLGWMAIREMFMDNQTVKLDINRFRPVMLEALQTVRRQQQQ